MSTIVKSAGALVLGLLASTAHAQTAPRNFTAALATEAAIEAVAACAKNGHQVTVTVLDQSGALKAVVKGDGSTPHTFDSSRGKAYTVLTLGPIFKKDTNGELAALIAGNPGAAAIANVPGILLLPGAVLVKSGTTTVASIGVGGAPGGALDEACAKAGYDKIKDRIG